MRPIKQVTYSIDEYTDTMYKPNVFCISLR